VLHVPGGNRHRADRRLDCGLRERLDRFQRGRRLGGWGEQILTDHAVAAGTNEISYSVPAGGEIPATHVRVRFTSYDTTGSLGVTGLAGDGEVEDYVVSGTPLFADDFEVGTTARWSVTVP